jgi:phage terminase small subunit
MASLTPRQQAFVREYLADRVPNATAAAERAGYGGGKAGAAVAGSRLLRVPKIAALIAEAQEKRAARMEVSADRVLAEVARLALADPSGAFNADGTLKALEEIPEELRRTIASVKTRMDDEGVVVTEVRFWDKPKSLELAMKHLGMLRDKVELSGENGQALSIHIDLGAGK